MPLPPSTPEGVLQAGREDVAAARAWADRLRSLPRPSPRDEVLSLLDDAMARLGDAGARAGLLRNVHPDPAVRAAAEQCEQEVEAVSSELALDRALHDAVAAVDLDGADPATRWMVERTLREFRRAGVDRDDATRERIRALRDALVRDGQEFGRHIREDVKELRFSAAELDGLPADWLAARPAGEDGRIRITTDTPDYLPVMTYARDPSARERLWRAHRTRGHPANLEVLSRMLAHRAELARLLGHPDWASHATEDKMIGGAAPAAAFIERVADAAEGRMLRDRDELLARKRQDLPAADRLDPWDVPFLSERIKAERLGAGAQATRPYLEYRAVRDGLLALVARLFGVTFRRIEGAAAWHPEVEGWTVTEGETELGRVWLDMHPREGKYPHFAQFTLQGGQAGRKLPEGVLVCNFPRPGARPALLEHGEVRTFLHELGHLMHHVLGGHTRWAAQAGVATEWDFVEVPSQLLEEWVWDPEVLGGFARHVETGAPIPADLVQRLADAEGLGKGLAVRQQMLYAALSLELHRRDPAGLDTTALVAELTGRYTPFRHVEGTWFQCSFGHLDGYSALYYTYMWSLVIAKDLFSVFRREGLLAPGPARRYREAVLAPGGSRPAAELVQGFLGRPPSFDAWESWLAR